MAHKLLLADDSTTIQRVIELTFAGEDVNVVAVGDGAQAIARIPIERPDIILADIAMPKRNGYDVAAFVKGHPDLRHIPVLLLAGAFEPVDEAKAEQSACDGVLVKPFEPQHVIARVRELLAGPGGAPQATPPHLGRPVERLTPSQPIPESRVPSPEPRIPSPASAVPTPAADHSLDDYFDRLDAAFTTIGSTAPVADPAIDPQETSLALPTLDRLLARPAAQPPSPSLPVPAPQAPPLEPADTSATMAPVLLPSGAPPSPGFGGPAEALRAEAGSRKSGLADVFTMLLAVEQGESDGSALRLSMGPPEPVVSDALVEEVTRRVLQKLGPDAARALVEDVVSDVAERLVREEIARIRGK